MNIKEKFKMGFKDMLGVGGGFPKSEYEIEEDEVVEDISEVGKAEVKELKTEFITQEETSPLYDVFKEEKKPEPIPETFVAPVVPRKPIVREEKKSSGSQTVFVEPKNYSECKKIANYIKENKTVTVNLESVESGIAQRILDFLSGASSIKKANFIPVSRRVYVIVPQNVEVLFEGSETTRSLNSIKLED